jgi:16S rRNA (cytidine1402-2'-O)-methyltransferase
MNDSKRQILPTSSSSLPTGLWPGLWVVATPIGNLGDITSRAKDALGAADWVLCEDTRRTAALFSALEIGQSLSKLKRMDAHQEKSQVVRWVEELQSGKNIVLVTDAGTPSISDPGSLLVFEALQAGIRVTPVPGASAVSALLSVSGISDTAFTFSGFFPRKTDDQKEALKQAQDSTVSRVFIWFESPLRIADSLELIAEIAPDAYLAVGKELTKLHETLFSGPATQVLNEVKAVLESVGKVGEWCFALWFRDSKLKSCSKSNSEVEMSGAHQALNCLFLAGISVSEASKIVSQQFGISKKVVYEAALQIFGKKNTQGG